MHPILLSMLYTNRPYTYVDRLNLNRKGKIQGKYATDKIKVLK